MAEETKITNQELLNSIREGQSQEYKNAIPMATSLTGSEVYSLIEQFPTAKNEFINTLVNKIGKEMFFNKVFNNPLKMLHRGMLPYGKTIQEMFVELAERKGFDEHFTGSSSNEADLIGVLPPSVKVNYITENFKYIWKTSLSVLQLRGAFTDQYGLNDLLTKTIDALFSSVETSEYKDMLKILTHESKDSSGGSQIDVGIVQQIYADTDLKKNCMIPVGANATGKEVCKHIRKWSNKLRFPKTLYNVAKVETFTNKNDLVLFVTPETQADIDVDALATAFNVSKQDVEVRQIMVDDLGLTKSDGGQEILAILADKDLVQAWDTVNETNHFEVPNKLTINYFAHKWGMVAQCPYANCIIFVKGDTIA